MPISQHLLCIQLKSASYAVKPHFFELFVLFAMFYILFFYWPTYCDLLFMAALLPLLGLASFDGKPGQLVGFQNNIVWCGASSKDSMVGCAGVSYSILSDRTVLARQS